MRPWRRGDLEAIMSVWAEDEEIVCIHPGSGRVAGYTAIREAWSQVFGNGQRLMCAIPCKAITRTR